MEKLSLLLGKLKVGLEVVEYAVLALRRRIRVGGICFMNFLHIVSGWDRRNSHEIWEEMKQQPFIFSGGQWPMSWDGLHVLWLNY